MDLSEVTLPEQEAQEPSQEEIKRQIESVMTDRRDPKLVYSRGMNLQGYFGTWFSRMDTVRDITRLRKSLNIKINGADTKVPHTSHGAALVAQFRAHINRASMVFEVPVRDNTDGEIKTSSNLAKWCEGVEQAVRPYCGRSYRDDQWHFGESGMAVKRTLFNLDRALRGQFCFDIDSIDPRTFAFQKAGGEIVFASIFEYQLAESLYWQLETLRRSIVASGEEPGFTIPEQLKKMAASTSQTPTTVLKCYDQTNETMFVDGELIWDKPHLMGRCPFDVGFCFDIPADPTHPEEYGLGLIWAIAEMLDVEQQVLAKTTLPLDLFYYPMAAIQDGTTWRVEQVFPGQKIDTDGGAQVTPFQPTPNGQIVQQLMSLVQEDMGRTAMPEAAFGPPMLRQSGFAWSQVLSGLDIKVRDLASGLENMYSSHFGMLLERVQALATDEMVEELELDNKGRELFFRSFAVQVSLEDHDKSRKVKALIPLKSSDIDDHTIVNVTMKPEIPQDENAKYQRGLIAKQIGYSREYISREVIKDGNPKEVEEMNKREELRLNDPEWAAFERFNFKAQLLKDPNLNEQYEAFQKALKNAEAEMATVPSPGFGQMVSTPPPQQQALPPGPGGVPGQPNGAMLGEPPTVAPEQAGPVPGGPGM